jgi:hypothetical protein
VFVQAYLLHPMAFNVLYSAPALLYPPSGADGNPAAAVRAALAAAEGATAAGGSSSSAGLLASITAPLRPALSAALGAWLEVREALSPSGAPATVTLFVLYTMLAVAATYAVAFVLMHAFETPARRLLTGARLGGAVKALTWYYSLLLMPVGALVHIVATSALVYYVRPEMEPPIIAEFEAKRDALLAGGGAAGGGATGAA